MSVPKIPEDVPDEVRGEYRELVNRLLKMERVSSTDNSGVE